MIVGVISKIRSGLARGTLALWLGMARMAVGKWSCDDRMMLWQPVEKHTDKNVCVLKDS